MANNWIGNNQPVQAKTEIRIQAQKADIDLNNMLVSRESVNPKLKNNVSVSGMWESFRQLKYRNNSGCQLYIDKDICEYGRLCKYNILRIECGFSSNPFNSTNTTVLTVGGKDLTDTDLYTKYNSINVVDYGTLEMFLKDISSLFSIDGIVTYSNRNYSIGIDMPSYLAIPYNFTVTIPTGTSVFQHLYDEVPFEDGLCVHIAGCGGLCAGEKIENNLPPSNIYKDTDGYPEFFNNCNPFDCYPIDDVGTGVCISKCPFGAIKHKLTNVSALPVNVDSLKNSSRALFTIKPFGE